MPTAKPSVKPAAATADGPTIRKRGRPLGSRNKPKPPVAQATPTPTRKQARLVCSTSSSANSSSANTSSASNSSGDNSSSEDGSANNEEWVVNKLAAGMADCKKSAVGVVEVLEPWRIDMVCKVDVAMAPEVHGDAMDTASGQVGADHQCASQLGPLPARTAGGVATDSSTAALASASWAKDEKHVPADKMPASTTTHLSTLNTSYGHCILPLGTALPSLVQLVTAMAYWPQLQPCLQASNVCTGLLQLMKWRPFHSPLHSAVGQLFCTIISHGAPALLSDLLIRSNLLGQLAQLPTTVPSTQGRMLRAGYMGVLAQIFDCMTATMQREEGEHADLEYRSTDKQHQQQHQQQNAQHAEESMEDASAITRQLFNIEDATSISGQQEQPVHTPPAAANRAGSLLRDTTSTTPTCVAAMPTGKCNVMMTIMTASNPQADLTPPLTPSPEPPAVEAAGEDDQLVPARVTMPLLLPEARSRDAGLMPHLLSPRHVDELSPRPCRAPVLSLGLCCNQPELLPSPDQARL
ncbi:hypothetical protein QJQ45_003332 [Haematococcus lacustris]|nr:hypothetical protein QJQ45_003332 [Haematococcus lacustris]